MPIPMRARCSNRGCRFPASTWRETKNVFRTIGALFTGNISFNRLGEVRKDVQVQVVKDGNWHHYAVISDPVLLAPPEE